MNALFEANPQCVLPVVSAENCLNEFMAWADGKSMDELQSIITIWQEVWNARNASWLEKKVLSSIQAERNAVQLMSSFAEEKEPVGILIILNRRSMRWQPPPEDVYKVNVDVALSTSQNYIGIGIAIRDFNGMFMAGRTLRINGVSDLYRAELLAVKEGLIFAWDASFRNIILEGDVRMVYNRIKGADDDLSDNGSILKDIVLYASWFRSFRCCYIFRECNEVADFLANKALRGETKIWLEDTPGDLLLLLGGDFVT